MAGYDPSDSEERRVMKAHYFKKSMISKGQSEADALRIASNYYHIPEESVKNFSFPESPDPLDDDVWFMLGGHTPISASEMLNEGDFFSNKASPLVYIYKKVTHSSIRMDTYHFSPSGGCIHLEAYWWQSPRR